MVATPFRMKIARRLLDTRIDARNRIPMAFLQSSFSQSSRYSRDQLFIICLTFGIFIIDLLTPVEYILGYFYTIPILVTRRSLNRSASLVIIISTAILTLLNIWFPSHASIHFSTIINRVMVVFALIVTGILSDRNAIYASAIAQQQAKLEAHNKLVSLREDFAGTLTHDLKTPLLGAIVTLEAFQKGQFGEISGNQQKILATMIRSHQTSLELVETLLDVYRNDLEGLQLTIQPLDLTQLVEEVANQMTLLAVSRQIHLTIHHSDSEFRRILWVQGDALQLRRVMTNLLTNAINHSRRGDRVEVLLETVNGQHCVKVLDMGAGIQPEEFSQLFQRFYQGNSDRQAKGSGLGLYLARQIITAHGGKIWAENRSQNLSWKGAMFGISLPIYLPEGE